MRVVKVVSYIHQGESPHRHGGNTMTTKITWDEAAANAETASVPQKLLNTVVPLYNKLIDIENKINAASDVDAAVAVYLESPDLDEETLTLKKQIEQAKSLI